MPNKHPKHQKPYISIDLNRVATPDTPPNRPKTSQNDNFAAPGGAKIDTRGFDRPRVAFGPMLCHYASASGHMRWEGVMVGARKP